MKDARFSFRLRMQIAVGEVTPRWFYRQLLWMRYKKGARSVKIHIRRGKYVTCTMRFTTADAYSKMVNCWERFSEYNNIDHNFTRNER